MRAQATVETSPYGKTTPVRAPSKGSAQQPSIRLPSKELQAARPTSNTSGPRSPLAQGGEMLVRRSQSGTFGRIGRAATIGTEDRSVKRDLVSPSGDSSNKVVHRAARNGNIQKSVTIDTEIDDVKVGKNPFYGRSRRHSASAVELRATRELIKDLKNDLPPTTAQLAHTHRLPLHEVQRIYDELEKINNDAAAAVSDKEFTLWMSRVFDTPNISNDVVEDASRASLVGGRVKMDDFFRWYVVNMFRNVTSMLASCSRSVSDKLVYDLASKHKVAAVTIDKIKQEFDRWDSNKNNVLDYDEFVSMIHTMLRAKHGDVSEARIQRFWQELDKGSGRVEFPVFAEWYLKYFSIKGDGTFSCGLVDAFYDSYRPEVQRRKSLTSVSELESPSNAETP